MKASSFFVASVDSAKKTVLLTGKAHPFEFLGASCPASIRPAGHTPTHSVAFFPEKEEVAIVAVSIISDLGGKRQHCFDLMLTIDWQGGEPFIDLDNQWVPSPERPGQVAGRHIELCVDDEWFSTSRDQTDTRYLPDGNLACRYIVGDAEPEEVVAAAEEFTDDEEQRRRLEADLESCRAESEQLSLQVVDLEAKLQSALTIASKYQQDFETVQMDCRQAENALTDSRARHGESAKKLVDCEARLRETEAVSKDASQRIHVLGERFAQLLTLAEQHIDPELLEEFKE